jgi:hypothetical protein
MGNSKQELAKQKKTSSKTSRKPGSPAKSSCRRVGSTSGTTDRKPSGKASNKQALPQSPANCTGVPGDGSLSPGRNDEPEPVDSAERLRSAISGDMSGARLVADITGVKNPRIKPPKNRCGPTLAEQLALEPPWEGPEEGYEDTSPRPQGNGSLIQPN